MTVTPGDPWARPATGTGGPGARPAAESSDPRAWPVAGALGGREPPLVLRGFEPPPHPWAPGHRGVDLAARPGAPVRAAGGGEVTFAGTIAGRGVVSVELTGTGTPPLRITYEPVRPDVRPGDPVTAGEEVGALAPGPFHCDGGCLHWGLLRGAVYLDPLTLLPPGIRRLGPSRLLPVYAVPPPPAPAGLPFPSGPAPRRAMETAARVMVSGSSAAPSSIRRTAASTMP